MQDTSYKTLIFDESARTKLLEGVNLLADAVKITMGPRGQNVIIEKPGAVPHLTKDGVTVARSINLKDKFSNLGIQMVKEASARTADVAGDGTTTATVLARAIYVEGLKMLAAGYSSVEMQRGISESVNLIVAELKKKAVPVSSMSEIIQVGTISANGDREIGELLGDAMTCVGNDGIITVEEARGYHTTLDVIEGLELDRGFLSPYFITNQDKMAAVMENPVVLLLSKKIKSLQDILPVLEKASRQQRSVFIISDEMEGEALQGLVLNKMKGTLDVCVIKSPEFGEARINAMEDLGILLGCEPITAVDFNTLRDVELSALGKCKKILSFKHRTIFMGVGGDKKKIEIAKTNLKEVLEDATLDDNDRQVIGRRLQRLACGVAVLRVGAPTEIELREKRDRVEDALHATQAAAEEGVVPGGGIALVKASEVLQKKHYKMESEDFQMGIEIVRKACLVPLRQIVANAGGSPEIIVQKALRSYYNKGYNVATEEWVDMFKDGIIDPLKVVRTALKNASSVARMLLSVGCAIVEDSSEEPSVDCGTGLIYSR